MGAPSGDAELHEHLQVSIPIPWTRIYSAWRRDLGQQRPRSRLGVERHKQQPILHRR